MPKIPESVLVVIHTTALDVLLIERADSPGFWQSVTGSKDFIDEALPDVAIREVAEETGIQVMTGTSRQLHVAPGNAGSRLDERIDRSTTHIPCSDPDMSTLFGSDRQPVVAVPETALLDWRHSVEYAIYPVWQHRYAPGVDSNTEHWFSLEVPAGTLVRLAPREHVAARWLPWQEAAAACTSPSNTQAILELPQRYSFRG